MPTPMFENANSFLKNPLKAYSYSKTGTDEHRFEVRGGDYYDNPDEPPATDDEAQGKNRAEMGSLKYAQFGRKFNLEFDFQVEAGQPNTADWLLLAQFHQYEDVDENGNLIDSGTASPPFAIQMRGERLEIVGRFDPNAVTTTSPDRIILPPYDTPTTNTMYLDDQPLPRDTWINMKIEVIFDSQPGGSGMLKVSRDDVVIVDYQGPIGYNDKIGPYLQLGVYRAAAAEATAASFRNIEMNGEGTPPPMDGTAAADNIEANSLGFWESEVLNGFGGDDTLNGGEGADTMNGGAGNDIYVVDNAGDVVNERASGADQGGTDQVQSFVDYTLGDDIENLILQGTGSVDATGNAGNNTVQGNAGNNNLRGMGGNDEVLADLGNDTVDGGAGNDKVYGGGGNDTVMGGAGNDEVYGEDGNDSLMGGAGNDTLEGGAGFDTLEGGTGNDEYVVTGTGKTITEAAGEGTDTVRVTVSYDAGASNNIEIINTRDQSSTNTLNISGTNLANELRGNNGNNVIVGRAGADMMQGFGGNDRLQGDTGADSLFGGDDNDTLEGGSDADALFGENGNDSVDGDAGNDSLYGGAGDDTLDGGSDADALFGEAGNDSLRGGAGEDTLEGGTGADTMVGGAGDDTYVVDNIGDVVTESAGGGSDVVRASASFVAATNSELEDIRTTDQNATTALNLTATSYANQVRGNNGANQLDAGTGGNDTVFGYGGDDTIIAASGTDSLVGGSGNDSITSGAGNDILRGEAGNDTLDGSSDNDTLYGGAGDDSLVGGSGDDELRGEGGRDTLLGGAGNDVLRTGTGDGGTVDGGAGDDTYYIEADGTVITEAAGGGTDTVRTAYSIQLAADSEIEVLRVTTQTTTNDLDLTGSNIANQMRGNDGDNVLNGGLGADSMWGYGGDDTYFVDNIGDRVNESAGNGTDAILTDISYQLSSVQSIEALAARDITGTSNLNLTGNGENNGIIGNAGNNLLAGGAGNDTIYSGTGNDTILGGAGTDTGVFFVDSRQVGVVAGGSSVLLTLEDGVKTISSDVESFKFSNTTLTYAQVAALSGQVRATSVLSGTNEDDLIGGSAGANTISGNGGDDWLRAGAGNDTLFGGDGDDLLEGAAGNDNASGGAGTDTYAFNLAQGAITVATATGGLTVTSAEGTDFISNDIERFTFTDGALTYAELAALAMGGGGGVVGGNVITAPAAGGVTNGTDGDDQINGQAGWDWINPGEGSDTIDGGDGNDMVSFVGLSDTPGRTNLEYRLDINLGTGTVETSGSNTYTLRNVERVTGTINADRIRGDAGDNELRGLGDYDWFVATTGTDTIDGGTGQDMISYVEWQTTAVSAATPFNAGGAPAMGADVTGVVVDLANTANNTNLAAGDTYNSVERITGSSFVDVFYGDENQNDFRGLGGYDWFVSSGGGRERYFGGDGIDTVTYFNASEGVTASLRNGAMVRGQETGRGTAGDAAQDLFFEIEGLVGTNFADSLTGNNGRNNLAGLDGDDFLFGYGGIDTFKGGAGNDMINGGAGSDYALYDGNRADFTLTRTAANMVTVSGGSEGTDSLVDVEYFRFNDGDVTIWELG